MVIKGKCNNGKLYYRREGINLNTNGVISLTQLAVTTLSLDNYLPEDDRCRPKHAGGVHILINCSRSVVVQLFESIL